MKKILFFILFCLIANISKADEADEIFCNKSHSCKKVCNLKREGKYSDLDQDNQKLMLKCIEDLIGEIK